MIINLPKTHRLHQWLTLALIIIIALALQTTAHAADAVGSFSFVKGKVDQLSENSDETRLAKRGDAVYQGDTIRTKRRAMAQIKFHNGSVMTVAAQSKVHIDSMAPKASRDKSSIRAVRGLIRTLVPEGDQANYEVTTPTAVAAVRGTEWVTKVGVKVSDFFVLDGIVGAKNIDPNVGGEVLIQPLHATRVSEGRPPLPPFRFNKDELTPILKQLDPGSTQEEQGDIAPPQSTTTTETTTADINLTDPLNMRLPSIKRSGNFIDMMFDEAPPAIQPQIQTILTQRKAMASDQQLLIEEIQPHEEQSGIQVTPEITELQPSLTGQTPVEIIIQFQ